ncbi:helix-turn-helix transcriptional regulator [Streptomyces sp. NBC_01520]|uniref:winged helix-turn-helix transcriptional regulator n=1 Tax=Streptomyces sp. NBC_01520 TaxID=2903892 RepID=UPI00386643D9
MSVVFAEASVLRTHSLAREIFTSVAGKWALTLINALAGRTLRFTELRAEVPGISQKMLTQTLRGLERDGLVRRTVYPTVPPRVEYAPADAGRALRSRVNGVCDWTGQYLDDIETARERYDAAPVTYGTEQGQTSYDEAPGAGGAR